MGMNVKESVSLSVTIPAPSLPGLTRQSMRQCRVPNESAWTAGSSPGVTREGTRHSPSDTLHYKDAARIFRFTNLRDNQKG